MRSIENSQRDNASASINNATPSYQYLVVVAQLAAARPPASPKNQQATQRRALQLPYQRSLRGGGAAPNVVAVVGGRTYCGDQGFTCLDFL